MTVLSEQENFRLAEIERYLMLNDPGFVRRMMRKATRRSRFFRWLLQA